MGYRLLSGIKKKLYFEILPSQYDPLFHPTIIYIIVLLIYVCLQ